MEEVGLTQLTQRDWATQAQLPSQEARQLQAKKGIATCESASDSGQSASLTSSSS